MVVDNVEEDHQSKIVRLIDQRFQIIGCSVGRIRGIRQDAIISPVALARKIVDRHQLDGGDTKVGQPWQFSRHTLETAKGTSMSSYKTVSRHGRPRQSELRHA